MGWTTQYTVPHFKVVNGRTVVDRKKCIDEIIAGSNGNTRFAVLKSAMVGSVWYGAIEITAPDAPRRVIAGVSLTCGKSQDGTIFGYTHMDENMGPCEAKCPMSILKILTEPTTDIAKRWRARCREYASRKRSEKNIAVPAGVSVEYRGGWILSSKEYRERSNYSGIRYVKMSKEDAIKKFVETYGTEEQKHFYHAANNL